MMGVAKKARDASGASTRGRRRLGGGQANDKRRLNEILDRYRAVSDEQDRAEAEAERILSEGGPLALKNLRSLPGEKSFSIISPRRKCSS